MRFDLTIGSHGNPVSLHDAEFQTGIGVLRAPSIGPFMVNYMSSDEMADSTLEKSPIARLLTQDPSVAAVSRFEFVPTLSRLDFAIEAPANLTGSEVYYYCPHTNRLNLSLGSPPDTISVRSAHPAGPLSGYVIVSSAAGDVTEPPDDAIGLALSLLLRRRTFMHLARVGTDGLLERSPAAANNRLRNIGGTGQAQPNPRCVGETREGERRRERF
jgi:hypothetical protein